MFHCKLLLFKKLCKNAGEKGQWSFWNDLGGMLGSSQPWPTHPHIPQGRGVDQHGALVWWESTPPSPRVSGLSLRIPGTQAFLELEVLRLLTSPKGSDEDALWAYHTSSPPAQLPPESKGSSLNYQKFSRLQKPQRHQICLPTQRRTPKHCPHAWQGLT